jgi:hypothetical protein
LLKSIDETTVFASSSRKALLFLTKALSREQQRTDKKAEINEKMPYLCAFVIDRQKKV